MPLQKFAEQAHCGAAVVPQLDEDLDHVAFLIHGTPKILPLAIDRDRESSRPGESHPEALTEPCVNLSTHTALTIRLHEA